MTGFREAARVYLARRKYRKWMWVISFFAAGLIIFSGWAFPSVVLLYAVLSPVLLVPDAPVEFMLPLSDGEIKKKYVNAMLLKFCKLALYLVLNTAFGLIMGNFFSRSWSEHWSRIPVATVILYADTFLMAVYSGMASLEDALCHQRSLPFFKKGLTRIIGTVGEFLYFRNFFSYIIFSRELFLNGVDGAAFTSWYVWGILEIAALITGMIGFGKEWKIKDFEQER